MVPVYINSLKLSPFLTLPEKSFVRQINYVEVSLSFVKKNYSQKEEAPNKNLPRYKSNQPGGKP
jgi:hypothetical protein